MSDTPSPVALVDHRRPDRPAFYWLATVALLVAMLARAQTILIPVALSVVVAFALGPLVKLLERRLGRPVAVAVVAVVALAAVAAFGYLLERQLVDLSAQMTKYSDSIGKKVLALRGPEGGAFSGLSKSIDRVVSNLDEKIAANKDARPVRVVPAEATAMERIQDSLAPIAEPLGRAVIVLVLVMLLLIRREDIRDRFIRLVGRGHVTLTTRTLDEAGQRISRFLAHQSAINGAFGVVIALGLAAIGIPYAPLWGFVAAIFRFVPFVGTLIMMIFPCTLAFAVFPGWWQLVATVGLFVGLDMLTGYVAEPMLIGAKTGVSSMAILVSAFFWAWLWGPVGLVLATPLTVCLAVLGKHVPRLSYLAVLLGDEPALEDALVLYHRLLSGDEEEAEEILRKRFRASPRGQVFDEVIIPALLLAGRDRVRLEISEVDHQGVLRTIRALVEVPKVGVVAGADAHSDSEVVAPLRVLGVSSRSATDETIWDMLSQLFDPTKVQLESVGSAYLASEGATAEEGTLPDLMCVIAIPPGGLTQARYICRRLRAKFATTPILVIRPGLQADAKESAGRLIEDGASQVCFTLAEAHTVAEQYLVRGAQTAAPKILAAV
ncbi:MAG TPA: AI-2E family transporter [Polyangia bacterium]|nr:AI-2E family transporter [Polyangia bacterium]